MVITLESTKMISALAIIAAVTFVLFFLNTAPIEAHAHGFTGFPPVRSPPPKMGFISRNLAGPSAEFGGLMAPLIMAVCIPWNICVLTVATVRAAVRVVKKRM